MVSNGSDDGSVPNRQQIIFSLVMVLFSDAYMRHPVSVYKVLFVLNLKTIIYRPISFFLKLYDQFGLYFIAFIPDNCTY